MTQEIMIRIMADWAVIPIVLIGTYALVFKIPRGCRFESYKRILLAGLTAYLVAKLASVIYQPSNERPFEVLGAAAGASFLNNPGFPSDHVLFVAAITCAVWFETKEKVISYVLAGLVVIVGVGRILALVHSPIDVIGGVVIALLGAVWYADVKTKIPK
jgi:membrane-associated phospholipid phosphatase